MHKIEEVSIVTSADISPVDGTICFIQQALFTVYLSGRKIRFIILKRCVYIASLDTVKGLKLSFLHQDQREMGVVTNSFSIYKNRNPHLTFLSSETLQGVALVRFDFKTQSMKENKWLLSQIPQKWKSKNSPKKENWKIV